MPIHMQKETLIEHVMYTRTKNTMENIINYLSQGHDIAIYISSITDIDKKWSKVILCRTLSEISIALSGRLFFRCIRWIPLIQIRGTIFLFDFHKLFFFLFDCYKTIFLFDFDSVLHIALYSLSPGESPMWVFM